METKALISLVNDIFFATTGLALAIFGLCRKKRDGEEEPHPSSLGELIATSIALIAPVVGPNILVIGLTPGMPKMPVLTKFALIPSIVLLGFIYCLSKRCRWTRLSNRIWTGIWTGAVTTGMLDVIRLTGFYLGLMPGNMPRMFGVLILDIMATGPTPFSDILGYLYHYWVGACFGLTLTLICGRVRWWVGLIWGIIIEVGMMTTPPMVVAMDTGYFGLKKGLGLLVVSLIAHIVYGTFLGLLEERYTRHKGSIIYLIRTILRKGNNTNKC